ncbi:MAG: hypothetical protein HY666_02470 [Chloroflexi bacterium]|nr:hypothetical protein [Chloroflexota bacterium]
MAEQDPRFTYAVNNTQVVRPPRQMLATFGTTVIRYYLVTEPVYLDLDVAREVKESVVREGTVSAEKPRVVTPYYLSRLEGFGDNARNYLGELVQEHGPNAPGLLYAYKNEAMETSFVSGEAWEVAAKIGQRLDNENKRLAAVILGVDELWDVSLLKFIYDMTRSSVEVNAAELYASGLLETEGGVPREARQRIQLLLEEARRGNMDPSAVKRELERWDLFDEYQDQFFSLFRRRKYP